MRAAWVMKLKPGQEAEYKRKHDEIWPEMVGLLKAQGISNYSIYRHGLWLFAHLDRDDSLPQPQGAEVDAIVARWQQWMKPHMDTNADDSAWSAPVEEMFRLD